MLVAEAGEDVVAGGEHAVRVASRRDSTASIGVSPVIAGPSASVGRSPVTQPARASVPRPRHDERRPAAAGRSVGHGGAGYGRPAGLGAAPPVPSGRVIALDAATVLLQWAVGGMAFCWFTTRRRQVGLGYGWLLRGIYAVMGVGAVAGGLAFGLVPVREVGRSGSSSACLVALAVSIVRGAAGVAGQRAEHDRRTARVAAMTGIDRQAGAGGEVVAPAPAVPSSLPILDLVPVAIGVIGLVAAALDAGGNPVVSLIRTLAGAAFLGAVTDAMLLGHWYLVQPGLPRGLLARARRRARLGLADRGDRPAVAHRHDQRLTGAVDDGWGGTSAGSGSPAR